MASPTTPPADTADDRPQHSPVDIAPAEPAPPASATAGPPAAPPTAPPEAAQPGKDRGLWAHPDFLKLWAGQSLSLFGTQVTILAMPVVAVFLLDATSTQMGLLGALSRAPFVLFLFAGVWADRVRRRPTMIWTDLGRGVLLALIPVLWLADALRIEWLYAIVLLAGILGVFFEVANQAYLPSLVGRANIPEGNAKLQISQSTAQVAGPGVAGLLISFFSAAMVVVIDAVSYFVSAIACALIRKPEDKPGGEGGRPNVFAAIGHGLRYVWTHPVLRPMVLSIAFFMTFATGIQTLYVLYLARQLDVPKGWIGVLLAMVGVGALVGSTLSMKSLRRFGPGPAAFWTIVLGNGAFLLVPLAGGPLWLAIAMLAVSQVLVGLTSPIGMVAMGSLRQVLTPNDMQGRVIATVRGLSLGLAPVGALLAGLLGSDRALGLHPTMLIFAVGVLIPIVVVGLSPIPGIREFPSPPEG
jgi:MFS family permease